MHVNFCWFYSQSPQLRWPITPLSGEFGAVFESEEMVHTCKMGYLATSKRVKGLIRRFLASLDLSISGLLTKLVDRMQKLRLKLIQISNKLPPPVSPAALA